jgi:glutamate synthase domain-containing protein 1
MRPRYNGLGGGFAAYGIYPRYEDCYALHLMFLDEKAKASVEEYLGDNLSIVRDEKIPTRKVESVVNPPILWRYFVKAEVNSPDDHVLKIVMHINSEKEGAFVMSSGKNLGVFKGVGYPEDVAKFYMIDEYDAFMWLGHGRYPTNTPGWWGGAHPFNILGWSVIHNGEISSYGTNKRYVEQWGYKCMLMTDSEVLAYLLDLLIRRHKLPLEVASLAMAPPFWKRIENEGEGKRLLEAIRMTYSDALVNGPFSVIVATTHGMTGLIGLTDRIKLRPLIAAEKDPMAYIASEECAIRAICPEPERLFHLKAGVPFTATVASD